MTVTFSREHFLQARAEWTDGEFSDEWKPYRHAAAMRGFIYPPQGTKWDSWDDDSPSQRAILIRYIRNRPKALMAAIEKSRSWQGVIGEMIREDEWLVEQSEHNDMEARQKRHDDEPTARQAASHIKVILDGIRP